MPDSDQRVGLFPALLRHWRRAQGLSQLDLALTAGVSARHVSFLETGRSRPSSEMVLLLARALGVPLRQVNAMLRAAGHEAFYEEAADGLPPSVLTALSLLKAHQEPFPLLVLDRTYCVLDHNDAALRVLSAVMGLPTSTRAIGLNLATMTFDPAGAQPHIVNFDQIGKDLLWRVQRELLEDPDQPRLRELLRDLLTMPTVDEHWRDVDLQAPAEPALVLHLAGGGLDLRFLTLITAFQAPQNVAVEHLRVESWFPSDDQTAAACRRLANDGT